MSNSRGRQNVPFWLLGIPVVAWALHFLASYIVAAVYCAKTALLETAALSPISTARWWIVAITLVTLAITGFAASRGYVGYRSTAAGDATDKSGRECRFLASVLLLLCALSAVAMLFVGAVAFSFDDCRR
jgi:hypothetical protein